MRRAVLVSRLIWIVLAGLTLGSCTSGGAGDSETTPTSNSPVVISFGAGTNPGGIRLRTPRFAFASNDDNTISQFVITSPHGQLRHNGYSMTGSNPGVVVVHPTGDFAYVPNQNDNTISAFTVNAIGHLTPITGSPFAAGSNPAGAVMHPSGHFLYIGNLNDASIQGYTINSVTGSLTVTGPSNAVGMQPAELAIDPSGQFLYVVNSGSNSISAFSINAVSGLLSPVSGSPFLVGSTPVALALDPNGRAIFTANLYSDTVTALAINPGTGSLSSAQTLIVGSFPTAVTLDLTGQYLLVANGGDDSISVFSINQGSGLVSPVPGSPFPADVTPITISVDPSGNFIYAINTDSGTVSIHSLDPVSGALTLIQRTRTRWNPTALAFTSGTSVITYSPLYAYVANRDSNSISAFHIDSQTGGLSTISGSPFGTGAQPISVASSPNGRFIYTINNGSNDITAYETSALDGTLSVIEGSPFSAGIAPVGLALDPTGRFLYVAHRQSSDIRSFLIDLNTGQLSPNGPITSLAQTPTNLAIDPTGQFLFAGTSTGTIYSHRINAATGSLTEVPGFPFPGPGLPPSNTALLVDPNGQYLFSGGSSGLGGIYLRTINPSTGALENGLHYGFSFDFTKQGLAIDPLGRYLYVAYSSGSDVFSIEQSRLALHRIMGSPFGRIGDSVAVDPSGQYLYGLHARCAVPPCNGSIIAHSIDGETGALSNPIGSLPTQFTNLTMTITQRIQ